MKKFYFWLKSIWVWITAANHLWMALTVVIIAVLYININSTEPSIRVSGLILQLLGIATVAWGIKKTREQFGHPGFLAKGLNWLLDFPPYSGKIISGSMQGVLPSLTGSAQGDTLHPIHQSFSIEERLKKIDLDITTINKRITQTENEIDRKVSEVSAELKIENSTRVNAVSEIKSSIEAASTGGLHISAIGALWLFTGVTFSTVPNEILKFIN